MVAGPPCFTKMKSSAEGVSLLFPPAIRHRRRIDLLCDGFREVELAGNHVAVADKNLEVNMGRAAWIPTGIDRSEVHFSVSPDELSPPEERLTVCRTGLLARKPK